MRVRSPPGWFTRVWYPVMGGAWGGWIGLQGLFQHLAPAVNRDTAAPIFVSVAYAAFAVIGLVAGAALATVVGGSTDWALQRLGAGRVATVCLALLVTVFALWQITDLVQTTYPGLRAERAEGHDRRNAAGTGTSADQNAHRNPCLDPPPTEARERVSWDAECR